MTATNLLDWIVAVFVCWASLTAIIQSPREATRCEATYTTGNATRTVTPSPTRAEVDAMIRDMKLHD